MNIFLSLIAFTFTFTLHTSASTIVETFTATSGETEQIKLRVDAIEWINSNVHGLNLISSQQQLGLHYIASLFFDRLSELDALRSSYDEIYLAMKPKDTSYSPFFVKDGIKIMLLGESESITDLPEYSHWKGKTVEEVFGYKGDTRSMDKVGGEATRNTCLLKATRVGHFPIGSANTFYHEFGHFLHMTTMDVHEFFLLEKLYLNAKAKDSFLDDYAAQSVHEYFAQGLEAYVAETKTDKDRKWKYTKSDREDLKKLDPDLFTFIEAMIEEY